MKKLLFVLLLILPATLLAETTTKNAPAASAQEGSPSTAWTNIDSVFINDDLYSVYTGTDADSLYITNFTMGIPAGATIDTIEVTTHALGSATQAARRLITLYLTKDGTAVAGDGESFQHAQAEDSVVKAGGIGGPLWNTTWTAAEVNASTFGVILWKNAAQAGTISLDQVTIRIHYSSVATDSLIPTDSIPPDGWQDGTAARVAAIQGAGDNIGSLSDNDTAGVGMQNTSLTNIDSIEVHFRAGRDGFQDDSIRVDIIVGGTRAVGDTIALGGDANYSKVFQDVPGGSGWTQAQVNGLTIEIISIGVEGLDENQMDWLYVQIHEPAAGGGYFMIIGD